MKKMKFLLPILVILALVSCEDLAGEVSGSREGGTAGDGGSTGDVEINLISVLPDSTGNGAGDKTTKLILKFNREVPGLTAADIDVMAASYARPDVFNQDPVLYPLFATRGTLTDKGGGVYELAFSFPSGNYAGYPKDNGGTGKYYVRCSVSVIKAGYTFTPPDRIVWVYPQQSN
jgi:hypothetical protein